MSWLDSVQSRLSLPVIASPMFIVSNPRLVAAECKAGIVGSFPALNARPAELLDEWLTQLKAELATHDAAHPDRPAAPFAVNQICHRSNDRLMRDMETCVKHQVPIIITSLQVSAELVAAAHSYGGVVFHDVISIRHAEKAIEAGVDGLILVCAGAGGHAGTLSPFALLPEIRRIFQGPIALAGAIANGQSILAAQAMGADFAYMGTRFIATQEANAVDAYKQMLVDTRAEDIVYSSLFTGVPGNYLKPSIAAAGMDPDMLPSADKSKMDFGSGGNSAAKAWRDIWGAGQGVGSIDSVPSVAELVDQLKAEYREAREDIARRAARFGA
ncbi:NAD(P)H-dependent flavin oxidoreductase [Ideonella oryzae]|uniref:Nitronate monooxygenase family protein n=1 Tax=Ideonella oryzae TaxID=2937441 RepID=A0ABT1BI84_9BURK|nr:nitronate monooxygenase family protein [Ideonella oryzae]MCO5975132.1 nitronate monooxygenase family protein [Ideonella oryzae]